MIRWMMAAIVLLAVAGCDRKAAPKRQVDRNPPTIGFIDAPAAGATLGPMFTVAGWALDESRVERVRIYLDDELKADVALTVMRPDVEERFNVQFGRGQPHGFNASIDAGSRKGYCTVRFEALDGRGALTQFATTTVKIEP